MNIKAQSLTFPTHYRHKTICKNGQIIYDPDSKGLMESIRVEWIDDNKVSIKKHFAVDEELQVEETIMERPE
jgi:hypothetical protein